MNLLLAQKQNNNDKRMNDTARGHFILAMISADDIMLGELLQEHTLYMGKYNKYRIQHWFKKQFASLEDKDWTCDCDSGISLDYYPGAEMHEFKYYLLEPYSDIFSPRSPDDVLFVLRLTLLYDQGKIKDIRFTKKYTLAKSIENITSCN